LGKRCPTIIKSICRRRNVDLDAIIYLIGVQELGKVKETFKKDEKIKLMHIAICRLLEPYGYYEFEYFDNDGWPHYKVKEELTATKSWRTSRFDERCHCKLFSGKRTNQLIHFILRFGQVATSPY
jgi:hypothetical protein